LLNLDTGTFLILFVFHNIADYLFQTSFEAFNKASNWWALIKHSFVYALTLTASLFLIKPLTLSLIPVFVTLFASHIVLDKRTFVYWWCRTIKKIDDPTNVGWLTVEVDQTFHIIIILIISFFQL